MAIARLASESTEYRKRREALLKAEIALKEQRERVAELRRQLPLDTRVEDYEVEEGPRALAEDGPTRSVRLSDLFEQADRPLVLYQFMYGAAQKKPCPMCTMWIDGFNGVGRHLRRWGNFAVVAQAGVDELRSWARVRGWTSLRLVSSRPSTLKSDLGFQDEKGGQMPGLSVFTRAGDGTLRHFYSGSAYLNAEHRFRGLDLYTPVWSVMDLTPEGRGDWMPTLDD